MNVKLTQLAVSIIETAYCLQVNDGKDKPKPGFDFDDEDDWFDQDVEFLMQHSLESLLQEIESEITSDWSTNESEQQSA